MSLTSGEKIIIELLCDAARPAGKKEVDVELVSSCVAHDEIWALGMHYPGLGLNEPLPPEAEQVAAILDMWVDIEYSYSNISPADQIIVNSQVGAHAVIFDGFDANTGNQYHIAKRFIEDLGLWKNLTIADLNSHSDNMSKHLKMLGKYQSLRGSQSSQLKHKPMTAGDIVSVCS